MGRSSVPQPAQRDGQTLDDLANDVREVGSEADLRSGQIQPSFTGMK
jgi:hypothetical protein